MTQDGVGQYVKVALDVPISKTFDYLAKQLTESDVGCRVIVSFGHRRRIGIIVALSQYSAISDQKIKPIECLLRDGTAIPAELLSLFYFCSQYYHYPLGQVIFTALPNHLRDLKKAEYQTRHCRYFKAVSDFQSSLRKQALVQRRLAQALQNPISEIALKTIFSGANKYLSRWLAAGLIEELQIPAQSTLLIPTNEKKPSALFCTSFILNKAQQFAVTSINQNRGFQSFLLYGVTGSGKTEVYMHIMANQLRQLRQILFLVPEINLTPQLEDRISRCFPNSKVFSLHSNVSNTQRNQIWLKAARGEVDIILGTRLAVFTPLPRLGLIILDEEHDSSFKQQEGLRYHARDIAVFRGKKIGIPVVLGSATPSLESWYNAQIQRYHLLNLPNRAIYQAQLPQIAILNTAGVALTQGLHPKVIEKIAHALSCEAQVLIFLNRRGYAPVLYCQQCRWSARCQRCSSRLVIHLGEQRLKCHLCDYQRDIPDTCPECGNLDIKPVGQGTQRIEAALKIHFPKIEIIRIDSDSLRQKSAWKDTFEHIKCGRSQILIGTQMLAKGHDFPHLELAVIINADAGLHSVDFRAEERLFSQLMQVAGRVGRAESLGQVLIQTQYPNHTLYLALQQHDYAPFAAKLLNDREISGFPPYCFQVLLKAEAHELVHVVHFLQQAKSLAPINQNITLYDPVPAAMQKIASKYRGQLLVQSSSRQYLHQFIKKWLTVLSVYKFNKIRWCLDIDPIEV